MKYGRATRFWNIGQRRSVFSPLTCKKGTIHTLGGGKGRWRRIPPIHPLGPPGSGAFQCSKSVMLGACAAYLRRAIAARNVHGTSVVRIVAHSTSAFPPVTFIPWWGPGRRSRLGDVKVRVCRFGWTGSNPACIPLPRRSFPLWPFWGSRWLASPPSYSSFPTRPHQGRVNALVTHSPNLPERGGPRDDGGGILRSIPLALWFRRFANVA